MRRSRLVAGAVAVAVLGLFGASGVIALPRGVRTITTATHAPERTALPELRVDLGDGALQQLLAAGAHGDEKLYVDAELHDATGTRRGQAALRGFSDWHHQPHKPSLRFRWRGDAVGNANYVELSRPEDVLALGNLLPERLCAGLGLPTAQSQLVRLFVGDHWCGVYLRSLRPGPELAQQNGLPVGTFYKGDSLGERKRLDLWRDASAWRTFGLDEPRSRARLEQLLAVLRQPPGPAGLQRLRRLLDMPAAARLFAVLALTGSIHSDQWHNHVWFHDAAGDRFTILPWDCNSFGIHALPGLPVDVAKHPLAAWLLCDPSWVHERDRALWQLLRGDGSAAALQDAAHAQTRLLGDDLRQDPGLGQLTFENGNWRLAPTTAAGIDAALRAFAAWTTAREAALRAYLDDCRVHACASGYATVITVSGCVGVQVRHRDGTAPVDLSGRSVDVLLPGRTLELFDAPQVGTGGMTIPAPHARPAPLRHELRGGSNGLVFTNAITGAPVTPSATAPPEVAVRSVR